MKCSATRKEEKGFTLIELAIVLVIIGLLLGSILKGKAMIENAKIKRVASDINGIVAAVYSYQDRYGYLPGDDPTDRSAAPPAGLGATNCTGGNGDGLFDSSTEYTCAWQELIGAGLMSGNPADTTENTVAKKSPYGAVYRFRYGTRNGKTGNYILVYYLPNDTIQYLDQKYDDGKYNSGDIQSNYAYTNNTHTAQLYWFAF